MAALSPRTLTRLTAIAVVLSAGVEFAAAHGIAGNRFFAGTLTFDDPAVADELIVPNFSSFEHPAESGNVVDNRFDWAFSRLLTPTLAVGIDGGWVHRSWPNAQRSGFDTTNVGLKAEIFRNNQHETLVSAGIAWGIGRSGAQGIGGSEPDTVQPGLFFGRGFGDLPDAFALLRPFAITGALVGELPTTHASEIAAPDPTTGRFQTTLVPKVDTLHWGFSIQYSTYYLTSRFTGGPPKEEPLNQLLPLVEFSFDSPYGQNTKATMNPGFAYVAVTWQASVEAILPLNRATGTGTGVRAQLLLFTDDLLPSLFGKPLLTDRPGPSLTAW